MSLTFVLKAQDVNCPGSTGRRNTWLSVTDAQPPPSWDEFPIPPVSAERPAISERINTPTASRHLGSRAGSGSTPPCCAPLRALCRSRISRRPGGIQDAPSPLRIASIRLRKRHVGLTVTFRAARPNPSAYSQTPSSATSAVCRPHSVESTVSRSACNRAWRSLTKSAVSREPRIASRMSGNGRSLQRAAAEAKTTAAEVCRSPRPRFKMVDARALHRAVSRRRPRRRSGSPPSPAASSPAGE